MDIENRVRRAVESVLGETVVGVERMPFGEVNRVYRAETRARTLAVKVFSHAGWPEPGKLLWVESELTRRAVPHARMLYHTRDSDIFPHGFTVNEFAVGRNCEAALADGTLSPENYFALAGAFLKRVHEIDVPQFGYIGGGDGTDDDFVGWLLDCTVKDRLDEVRDPSLPVNLYSRVERKIESLLRPFERRFRPVLLHGDAVPRNALLGEDGRLLFVDWDEAVAGVWVADYTRLSYWYSYERAEGGGGRERAAGVRASFLRGYGRSEFEPEEFDAVESALHAAYAADLLAYYHKAGRAEPFGRTRELLLHMLG